MMRYYEDMLEKHGFSSGDTVPEGCDEYRTVYIRLINQMADHAGSEYRAVAFDRFTHNPCMILYYKLADLNAHNVHPSQYARSVDIPVDPVESYEIENDPVMVLVIQAVHSMLPDQLVIIEPRIDQDALDQMLGDIALSRWMDHVEDPNALLPEEIDRLNLKRVRRI